LSGIQKKGPPSRFELRSDFPFAVALASSGWLPLAVSACDGQKTPREIFKFKELKARQGHRSNILANCQSLPSHCAASHPEGDQSVDRRFADAQLPRDFFHCPACFHLLQHADDLFFRVFALFHPSSFSSPFHCWSFSIMTGGVYRRQVSESP
jgi:hypothetical protein